MLSKDKALYQVKLILDYLPEEEYKLIPKETIDYIEDNFEYDENIVVDPKIPLEQQKIDDKAYEILDKILNEVSKKEDESLDNRINTYIQEVENSNQNYNIQIENIRLKNLVEMLKKENNKITQAKDLVSEYKDALKQKNDEIEKLKKNNQDLYNCINGLPKIIKNLFIKNVDINLLKS